MSQNSAIFPEVPKKGPMQLWVRVIFGMALGAGTGLFLGPQAATLGILGHIFLNLIKMAIVPLVFFTIVYGITGARDYHDLKRVSFKAICVFLSTAVMAVLIGIITTHLLSPGLASDNSSIVKVLQSSHHAVKKPPTLEEVVLGVVPSNIFQSMVEGSVLQIIGFAFFVGLIMKQNHSTCKASIELCHEIAHILFKMIEKIMLLAPIGVFGYVAALVGTEGLGVILNLIRLIYTIAAGCTLQYFVFGILIVVFGKLSPLPFYRKMIGPQLLAFSTSSSKATLAPLMKLAEEKLGISKQSSRFLLPLSAALNMDGGAIYQASCAIFFVQVLQIDLSFLEYLKLIFMCTIASIGGAGIPGGVLIFLGMVLESVGVPIAAVLIVASVDRILDMFTTTVNITGDACVTLLIDRSEKTLDEDTYYSS